MEKAVIQIPHIRPALIPALIFKQRSQPNDVEPTGDEDALPLSSAFPYTLSTPPTRTSSILIRRITALGTAAVLLYLLYPLPHLTSLVPSSQNPPTQASTPPYQRVPYLFILLQTLDLVLETTVILLTLLSAYHLALYEGEIVLNHKAIELKWLIPATTAAVALAAAAEETWIKTNLLCDLVLVLGVCGWKVMSTVQRGWLWLWIEWVVLGRLGGEVWWGEGWKEVRAAVKCLTVGLGEEC